MRRKKGRTKKTYSDQPDGGEWRKGCQGKIEEQLSKVECAKDVASNEVTVGWMLKRQTRLRPRLQGR